MDPRLTKRMLSEGIMPNLEKFIHRGSACEDLVLLGGHPTVTPPMWTTLSTGAYPITHGITCFFRQSSIDLDYLDYNLDSRNCHAEPLWNVTAEAGLKTLVWQWPGSSWPPTSDSPNLAVVDGTSPGTPNSSIAKVDNMFIEVASVDTTETMYRPKLSSDGHVPCVIDDLKEMEEINVAILEKVVSTEAMHNIILTDADGEAGLSQTPYDAVASPIKDAHGWANAPEDAKEFYILFSGGFIRRPALILKNENGIYDKVAVYKSKKGEEPLYTLRKGVYEKQLLDEAIRDDKKYQASRDMRILELAEDGTYIKMWVSDALDITNDTLWHPKELYKELVDKFGYVGSAVSACGPSKQLLLDCMLASWENVGEYQANAIKYLIHEKNYDVVFSHYHNVDCFGHAVWKHIKKKDPTIPLSEDDVQEIIRALYKQTDDYIGKYMSLLDEDWTIFIVSDHGQICPEYKPLGIGDDTGVNVRVMQDLGFTTIKTDENGNELYEIDWEKTKAIAIRGNHIYLNLKGREKHTLPDGRVIDGIVDPKDKYEVEEEIITALYGYRHPVSGKRIISLALRNKDAVILGMGGPECGDIIYFNAEGYNYDHVDSISTTYGCGDTSVSPIFFAAGKGIKQDYTTTRWIREVDVTPTIAVLLGVRMPNECEGAPVYQIIE